MKYDLFNCNGIEKAAFFLYEHDELSPKEIIRLFLGQFGEAVDPEELTTDLIVFNVMPENSNEVFKHRYAEFLARFNASR
jgi:hypothetical protein